MGAYMKKHNLTNDEISTLCLELALLLHSGVDAGSGLFLLAEEEGSSSLGTLLTSMARQVDEGGSLAGASRPDGRRRPSAPWPATMRTAPSWTVSCAPPCCIRRCCCW